MEHTFEALGLRAALVTALAEQGITAPTEIQQKMIPEIYPARMSSVVPKQAPARPWHIFCPFLKSWI